MDMTAKVHFTAPDGSASQQVFRGGWQIGFPGAPPGVFPRYRETSRSVSVPHVVQGCAGDFSARDRSRCRVGFLVGRLASTRICGKLTSLLCSEAWWCGNWALTSCHTGLAPCLQGGVCGGRSSRAVPPEAPLPSGSRLVPSNARELPAAAIGAEGQVSSCGQRGHMCAQDQQAHTGARKSG